MIRHPTALLPASGPRRPGATSLLLPAFLLAVLASCSDTTQRPNPNLRPSVRIVRGEVVEGDTVEQVTRLSWIGWDDDGYVDHYQFAFDIPGRTLEEINDSLTTGIAWRDTLATDAIFLFTTPDPETLLGASGQYVVTDRYLGRHSFYVRSVDDRGAVSDADVIDFTASNIIPKTRIVTPDFASIAQFAQVGSRIYIRWTGKDEDKLSPDLRPAAFEYKLIPIPSVFGSIDPQYAVDVSPGPQVPWTRVSGGTNQVYLNLDPPQAYWFVVRGIDVAGAVEQKYVAGQNAFKFSSSERNYDKPILTVTEATFGKHVFPNEGLYADVAVYTDQCLKFNFTSNMSAYGGTLQGYNVGVDVDDVDDDSQFHGWTLSPYNILPICFTNPGTHTVVILCRDTSGEKTVAIYNVSVDPVPPRDREVLLVDDVNSRSGGNALDTSMDIKERAFVRAMGYADRDIYTFDTYGAHDLASTPTFLSREELGRYRTIVWHVDAGGLGGNGRTGLVAAMACDPKNLLQTHIETGGAFCVIGYRAFGATKRTSSFGSSCASFVGYDAVNGMDLNPTDFLCRVMKICGGDFHEARPTTSRLDGLVRALPTDVAAADGFPMVEADSSAYLYQNYGGIPWVDAAFGPVFGGFELDSLYTMRAASSRSPFNGRVMAFRRAEADPESPIGPMAIFGFSFHELKPGSAEARTGYLGLARALGDWFRARQAVAAPDRRGRPSG